MEAIALQIGDHLFGSREARLGEFVVAAPVGLKPAGIDVDDVGRDAVLAQLGGHGAHFGFGKIADAAHPQAERPQRWHGGLAGNVGVLVQDVLGRAEKDEQVERIVAQQQLVREAVGSSEIEGGGRRGVDEHAVAAAAHEERDRLVHASAFDAVGVVGPEDDFLAALIEAREGFAAAEQFLIGRERKDGGQAARVIGGAADEGEWQRGIERSGEVGSVLGLGEQAALGVAKLDVPRVLENGDRAGDARVAVAASHFLHLPGVVVRRLAHQHRRWRFGAGYDPGLNANANRAR